VLADARPPALLASAPLALVLADARPPALLALAPLALVLADARPPALLAFAPFALVLAEARAPTLLALAPDALVLADARPPALLASAPLALVLAEARPPALLALAPLALVLAQAALACRTFCFRPRCCPRPAAAGPFCRIAPRVCAARRLLGPGVRARERFHGRSTVSALKRFVWERSLLARAANLLSWIAAYTRFHAVSDDG